MYIAYLMRDKRVSIEICAGKSVANYIICNVLIIEETIARNKREIHDKNARMLVVWNFFYETYMHF